MAINCSTGCLAYCDYDSGFGRGIRPVVCLKSETKLNIKGVTNDGNKIYCIE